MNENIVATLFLSLFVLSIAVTFFVIRWKKMKEEASYPKEWVHVGTPPANVDIALSVIKSEMQSWTGRYGGTIEWVDGPFKYADILCAGYAIDLEEPRIRVMKYTEVWRTALSHEIYHVWQYKYNRGHEIYDGDPRLASWVAATNMRIKEKIAAVV